VRRCCSPAMVLLCLVCGPRPELPSRDSPPLPDLGQPHRSVPAPGMDWWTHRAIQPLRMVCGPSAWLTEPIVLNQQSQAGFLQTLDGKLFLGLHCHE
jgi:hypothetical protein